MKQISILCLLLAALVGWLLTGSSSATPPIDPTVTVLTLPVDQVLSGSGWCWSTIQGDLKATFEATPQSGAWRVKATFKPVGLSAVGWWNGSLGGKAAGTTTLAVGTVGYLSAQKLNFSGAGSVNVNCSLTVDANGTVSVQTVGLSWVGVAPPCGNSTGNHHVEQQ